MQPAAAKIKRKTAGTCDGPSSAAQARARLDQQAVDRCLDQPPARSNAGRAAADDDDFSIADGHWGIFYAGPISREIRRAETRGRVLAHAPERQEPVFGQDHAPTKSPRPEELRPRQNHHPDHRIDAYCDEQKFDSHPYLPLSGTKVTAIEGPFHLP